MLRARFRFPGRERRPLTARDLEGAGLPLIGSSDATAALSARLRELLGESKTVAVVPVTGGGASVALALSKALASGGSRVVLVDADLRSGGLSKSFEAGASVGLSGLLVSYYLHSPLMAIVRTEERNLYLLPAGDPAASASRLLRSRRLGDVVSSLREMADYVVIETAPMSPAEGIRQIAAAAGVTLLALEDEMTPRELRKALQVLAKQGVRPDGAVLNGVPLVDEVPEAELPSNLVPWPATMRARTKADSAEMSSASEVVEEQGTPSARPALRLIQPYERPLLPFDEAGEARSDEEDGLRTNEGTGADDVLQISVTELLADLESTLALIRELRQRQEDQTSRRGEQMRERH